VPEAVPPTVAPSGEPSKDAIQDRKPRSTFPCPLQPHIPRAQHEGARNYKKDARQDWKKQPGNAYKRQNPPKSNEGDALEWGLRFVDDIFHTGSSVRSLNCRRHVSVTFSDEHRRQGARRLSQQEGICGLKFSDTLAFHRCTTRRNGQSVS
jgi:hypothetical protein